MGWLNSAALLFGIVGSLVAALAYLQGRADRKSGVEARIVALETKVELFWAAVQQDMIKILHHPRPQRAEMDALLDKLGDGALTDRERERLHHLLEAIRDAGPGSPPPFPIDPAEQVAAVFLLRSMEYGREAAGERAAARKPRRRRAAERAHARWDPGPR